VVKAIMEGNTGEIHWIDPRFFMTFVYVKHQDGSPLMPTHPAKARILLRDGRAKVVSREPFTIQLLYETTKHVQELTLGVDPGSGTAGFAVVDPKGNSLYASEVQLRQDVTGNMTQRRNYRRNRRSRKTRYREARFLNRGNSKRIGRYPPTLASKYDAHIREIEAIRRILPIEKVTLEDAQFDLHAAVNPYVCLNKALYQTGPQYGFENVKAYVLYRDGHVCQCCGGKSKEKKLRVHHKVFRSEKGKDTPDNLVTVCKICHQKIHDGTIIPKWKGKAKDAVTHVAQLNIIISRLKTYLGNTGLKISSTFGFITKVDRRLNKLDKTHYNDAISIAAGNKAANLSQIYIKRCVSKGDYQLTKGKRSEKRLNVGKINGFRKFDEVYHQGQYCFVQGRMSTGYMKLMDINGKNIDFKPIPKPSNTRRIRARRSVLITRINP
jgi:hypothetical protein